MKKGGSLKIILFTCILSFLKHSCMAQTPSTGSYIKVSGGRMLFGTGDIDGFGIHVEGSGNLIKKNKYLLNHLQIGGELCFENAANNPTVINPTPDDFKNEIGFQQISMTSLNGKITFYPFNKIVTGFNISISGGASYYYFSYEGRAVREEYTPTLSRRMSELRFENKFMWGYRISVGYDFFVKKKILFGPRYDFCNYTNGDFNYFLGGRIGYRFN